MKAVPNGRIPKEGWQLVMERTKLTVARITQALNYAYEKGEIPKKWQLSETAQLNKSYGKEGT